MRSFVYSLFWIGFLISNIVFGYNRLWVEDPQNPWRDGRGTIEEAVISVRPQGIYMEFGLYLTFSARDLGFNANDLMEVQFFFNLPENAIVNDLWLWVGEDIMRAKILDKWSASEIYEDIVDRRRDPAILFKRSQTQYELRVYPMAGDDTRKIKLTYLVPTHWLSESVTAALPVNLLRTSKNPLSTFHLLYWLKNGWVNPRLNEFSDIPFSPLQDEALGEYFQANIPAEAINADLHIALDSPLLNGVYVNALDLGGEGFYQLAFLPSQALDQSATQKVAFLFDYDASKSNLNANEVIATFKSTLHQQFTASDSFNIIFSNLNIIRAGEHWFAGDSAGIEDAFYNAGSEPLADYSNLPALLQNGIDFIQTNGNRGSIMLISNSDHIGNYTVANSLIDDLLETMDSVFPIHVVDFLERNIQYYHFGGRSYRGNEYFYDNISRITHGNYRNASGNSFSQNLLELFQSLSGFINSFDLYTTLEDGFCFGRFNLTPQNQAVYLDRPILQIGKYFGSFPFHIEASGIYNNQPFFNSFEISANTVSAADTLSEEIWAGNYIKELELEPQTNSIIDEIIDLSLSERVLSLYTAFLALEPNDSTIIPCDDCYDETDLVGIEDSETPAESDSLFIAYPNPFNSETTIRVKLSQKFVSGNATIQFRIFNVLGQVVRSFQPETTGASREYQFTWNGQNESGAAVASGTYFFIVSTASKKQVLKLLLIK